MENSDKFVLVASLDPLEKGDEFTRWPLHVTLLPWFTIPDDRMQAFDNSVKSRVHTYEAQYPAGDTLEMFGPEKNVPVRTLKNIGRLAHMHRELVECVERVNGTFYDSWIKDNFRPHLTFQKDKGIDEDELIALTHLELIWGDIHGNRRVEQVYNLPRVL